jgi:predicted nucleic acid-binding protein
VILRAVFLDSGPLGLVTQRSRKSADVDACKAWIAALDLAGVSVYVPEVIDYEIRRELLRAGKTSGVLRLELLKASVHYLPLSTPAMLRAATLWAEARRRGIVTAAANALDVDVILCAQALTLALPVGSWVIATSNVAHLSHYAPANVWQNITL